MENVLKTLTEKNKWLFQKIDSSNIYLKFENYDIDDKGIIFSLKDYFKNALAKSMEKRQPIIIMINNAEELFSTSIEYSNNQIKIISINF